MPPLPPAAGLDVRPARSYVDLPTNVGLIAKLSAGRDLGAFVSGRLPLDLLPVFLHEAMHHWCFHSSLGFAVAAVYQRAVANAAIIAEAANSGGESSAVAVSHAEFKQAFDDLLRFELAFRILKPMIEGLALFAEFNVEPVFQNVMPLPLVLASEIFTGASKIDLAGRMDALRSRLAEARNSPAMIDRKHQVLLKGIDPAREPYCAGYLSIKSTWSVAAALRPELSDSSSFLIFLRNFIFEDLGLAQILLRGAVEGPDRSVPFASDFASRLRDRLRSLFAPGVYSRFDQYVAALERAVETAPLPNQPLPPEISLSDAETVAGGWSAINALIDDFQARSASTEPSAFAWSIFQAALDERFVQILDTSAVYVRVSRSGVCSVWTGPEARIPLLTGALSSSPGLQGQEGHGLLVLAVSPESLGAFFAVLLNDEIAYDTIPALPTEGMAGRIRRLIKNVPFKLQLTDVADATLTVLFRRGEEPQHAHTTNVDASIETIYTGQALPWLGEAERAQVVPRLAHYGLGLAALLPRGKRHLLKTLVAWSLGAAAGEHGIQELLAEASEQESLLDVFARINGIAMSVWGKDIIHVEGERINILF